MRPITTAVVGLGRIAWSDHLPQLANSPCYELIAVVDPDANRGREAAAEFGHPHVFNNLETMLSTCRPELTVIASPTCCHATQSCQALQAGSHVFCDKPAGIDLAEVKAMFNCATANRRKLQIYQPRRFFPETAAVRQLMTSGHLGQIHRLELHVEEFIRRNDWQSMARNGGGVRLNFGAHYLDVIAHLLAEPLQVVHRDSIRILSLGDADDVTRIALRSASGIRIEVDLDQACALPGPRWRIFGNRGAAVGGPDGWQLRWLTPQALAPRQLEQQLAAPDRRYPAENIVWQEQHLDGYPALINAGEIYYRHLPDWLRGNSPPLVPASDTLALFRMLDDAAAPSTSP